MGASLKYLPYDALGGAAIPHLSAGQFTVDPSGNYTFSNADVGKQILITDTFFYNNRITQETHVIPTSAPYTFQADEGGIANTPDGRGTANIFQADYGVRYYTSGTALTRVGANPTPGQYTISQSGGYGTYGFSAADAGQEVIIAYEYYNFSDDLYAPSTLNVTFFPGVLGQQPWAYLASAHPDQSLGYSQVAYAAFQAAYLGMSASPPDLSYEVIGFNVLGGAIQDASPVDCLYTLLTDPDIGIGFPIGLIDSTSWYTLANSAQNWVLAEQLLMSQALTNQEPVATVAGRWLEACQLAAFFSEGLFKILPFGDEPDSSALGSYVPNTTIVASFTDDDYLVDKAEDPIEITRSPWTDAYNRTQVTYTNRFNAYNPDLVYEQDEASIERFGLRLEPPVSYDFLMSETAAAAVANLRLKRNVQIRNSYRFRVALRYEYLEPMDLVSITDSRLGIEALTVRVTSVENDLEKGLTLMCEDYPGAGYAMPVINPKAVTPPSHPTYWSQPALATTGIIIQQATSSGSQSLIRLSIYATGTSPTWGGCLVWASLDGVTYNVVATVTQPARIYTLTAPLPAIPAAASGSYQATLDTTDTLALTAISPVTASQAGIAPYQATVTYSKGGLATYNTQLWVWVAPTPGNSLPTTSNPAWQLIANTPPAGSALESVTATAAQSMANLAAILDASTSELTNTGIELLSYEDVAPGAAANSYNLTRLYRGAFNTYASWTDATKTTPVETQSFPAESVFVRYSDANATYDVPAGYAGQTIYFRFTAMNIAGGSAQDVGQAQTYAFKVAAAGSLAALEFGPFANLDQIPNGATYGKTLLKYLVGNGVVYNFLGPWDALVSYDQGTEVSYNGNYWKAVVANEDSIPTTTNPNWQLLGPITTDNILNGEFTYVSPQGVIKVANLPFNGYFDIWPNVTGAPEGWEGASFGDGNTSIYRIANSAPNTNGGGAWAAAVSDGPIVSQPFGVTAGQHLQLYLWVKAANANPSGVKAVVYYFSNNQNVEAGSPYLLGSQAFALSPPNAETWTQYAEYVDYNGTGSNDGQGAPSGTWLARLALYNTGGTEIEFAAVAIVPQVTDTLAVQGHAITEAVAAQKNLDVSFTANTWTTLLSTTVDTVSGSSGGSVVLQFGGVFVNNGAVDSDMTIQVYRGTVSGGTLIWQQAGPFTNINDSNDFVTIAIDDAPLGGSQVYTVQTLVGFAGYVRSGMFLQAAVLKR